MKTKKIRTEDEDGIRFTTDIPQRCPYCLEYTREFRICHVCGIFVCERQCSIELMHGSSCCECASHDPDMDKSLHRFIMEKTRSSGGMIA